MFTERELELIEEGLNYCEEHGAPAMSMRPHTKRMQDLIESIIVKLTKQETK